MDQPRKDRPHFYRTTCSSRERVLTWCWNFGWPCRFFRRKSTTVRLYHPLEDQDVDFLQVPFHEIERRLDQLENQEPLRPLEFSDIYPEGLEPLDDDEPEPLQSANDR